MSTFPPPYLRKLQGNAHQLYVKGQPFLIRSAELHNSSMSSARWMQSVWPKMVEINVNTLLGCISWEQTEPKEGEFEYGELDQVLMGAREHGLHLIILWFGAHKNGQGWYAPEWVKKDLQRFPRAKIISDGIEKTTHTFSVFSPNTVEADAKAFARLMAHIKKVDQNHQTVIMVQVQNEVGLLRDTRDRAVAARKAFAESVPSAFLDTIREQWEKMNDTFHKNFAHLTSESIRSDVDWAGTFGDSDQTDELFMAYHYALNIETMASKGKQEYDLPMFTNAWMRNIDEEAEKEALFSGGVRPGDYPSGGPVETVLDIWQLLAPSLDFLAPDIYLTNYTKTCQLYVHRDQALFIPEQRRDEYGAIRIWEAIGRFNAIATSPFGIDSHDPTLSPFTQHYKLLRSVSPLILDARSRGLPMYGFFFDRFAKGEKDPSPTRSHRMGEWDLVISRSYSPGHPSPGFGMVIQYDQKSFLAIGEGFQIVFTPISADAKISGFSRIEEKEVVHLDTGELKTLRLLNGDEIRGGFTMPATNPDMGDYVITAFISANTRIAMCTLYVVD